MHILRNFHLEYLEDLLFFHGRFYIQDNLLYLLLYLGLYLYCNFHLFLILILKPAFYFFYLNYYQIFYFFDLYLYFETILIENKIYCYKIIFTLCFRAEPKDNFGSCWPFFFFDLFLSIFFNLFIIKK